MLPGREGFLKVPIVLAGKEPWRAPMLPSVQLGFDVTLADAGVDVPGFAEAMNSGDVLLAVDGYGMMNHIFLLTEPC
jgi:hypothetical protein